MVNSARRLDAKENHKVVVEEEGKPDQKYMSLTESLWTKSFDSRKSDISHREQRVEQVCLGDHSNPTNNFPLTSSNQSWPSWTSGTSSKDLSPAGKISCQIVLLSSIWKSLSLLVVSFPTICLMITASENGKKSCNKQ